MIVLSLDIGKKGGVVIYDYYSKEYILKETFSFNNSYKDVYDYLNILRDKYFTNKKVVIVIGEAFGQRVVVKKHSKFYGVIELFSEMFDYNVVYYNDVHCRSVILGKGNGQKKDMVQEKYKEATPDISDARLFLDTFLLEYIDK